MDYSSDVLTKFNLLTDDLEIETIRGGTNYICCGTFDRERYSELFESLKLDSKIKQCEITIYNADYVSFFDDEDRISNEHDDAPYIAVTPCSEHFYKIRGRKFFRLSKQDMVTLSKFLICYYQEIIDDLGQIEKALCDN